MPFSKSAPLSRLIGLIVRNGAANLITRNGAAKRVRFVFLTFFFAVVLSSLPVHLKHDGANAESRRPRRTQGLASRNLPDLCETNGNAASGGPRNEPGLNGPSPIAVQSGGVVTVYPSYYQTPAAGGGEAVNSPYNTGHGSTTSSRQIWNSNGVNSQTKTSSWSGFQNVSGTKVRVTVKWDWSFDASVETAIADQSGFGRAYARIDAYCSAIINGGSWSSGMIPRDLDVRVGGEEGWSDNTSRSGSEAIDLPDPNSIDLTSISVGDSIYALVETYSPYPTGSYAVANSTVAISNVRLEVETVDCIVSVPADQWRGEYYNNTGLSGAPAMVRNDGAGFLNINFGDGGPGSPCIPVTDNFSARWTRTVNFEAGIYRFTATSDDGVRVYVDGQLKIDQWTYHPPTTYTADVALSAGNHEIRLEFFEGGGGAVAILSWAPVCQTTVAANRWKGEYFNNQALAGSPAVTRDDGPDFLNLNFGGGSPWSACGVISDNFSARWTRTVNFAQGIYRFSAAVDNGVRLYIDGYLRIDQWGNLPPSAYRADVFLPAGNHEIKLELIEYTGGASAALAWAAVAAGSNNMAFGKLASQSSTYSNATADRAIDGYTDGNYYNNSLTHTNLDHQPWWQVDLGSVQQIGTVKLWNRTDCCSDRLSNFYVLVSDNPFSSTDLTTTINQAGVSSYYTAGPAGALTEKVVGRSGRYVRVQLAGDNYLHLAEVEVQGLASGSGCVATVPADRWKGEYYSNTNLSGSPALTRDDGPDFLSLNFGAASPSLACGLSVDYFSARWTRTVNFAAGTYRFTATADDGVRLYVDGQLKIDQWAELPLGAYTADVSLTAGDHQIKLEFFETWGNAVAGLSWINLSCFANVPADRWKGEYYNNNNLAGAAAMVSDNGAGFLNFNWGAASPSSACGLGADNFSARWTRTVNFAPGTYRFYATVDNGARLYVDGQLKIDQWVNLPPNTYTADVSLSAGNHEIKLEFVEYTGDASANLFWTTLMATDLNMALIDPINRIGLQSGEDLLSRNYNWSLPLLSLPGRAGLDFDLTLSLNSLIYTRVGSAVHFDLHRGNPAPGFRLGFPEIRNVFFNTEAGAQSYLLSMPSGRVVEFRQINMNVYEAVDSSYMLLTRDPINSVFILYSTDGTQCKFADVTGLGDYKCVQIKDRHGNYITIGYGSLAEVRTVTDALARVTNFNYDGFNHLLSITQNWGGQTHTWATFAYGTQTIQTNFPGLTLNGTTNGAQESVLQRVGLADGSVYSFEYNTYAQVKTIRRYAPNNSNPVNFPGDYFQRAYTTYGLPSNASDPQTDCPRITSRTDWADAWNPGVTSVYAADPGYAWGQVTYPDGTIYKEFFATTGWQRGLTTQTENWSGGVRKKWTTLDWTQDNTGVVYKLNPRVTETHVRDEANNHRRTRITYTSFGLPSDVDEYDADATTVLRHTHTDYNLSAVYTSRRIIGLPSATYLYDGNNTLFSKVTYGYDQNANPYLQSQGPPVQHDTANYGPDFVQGRGNLNVVKRWDVTNPNDPSQTSEYETGYNTSGSVVFNRDPLDHQRSVSYADSFSDGQNRNTYAYPTTVTDADNFSSTIQYNFYFGAVTRMQDPKGAALTRIYDPAGRIERETNMVNGAYTRYVYGPNQSYVQSYTTVNDLSAESYSIKVFDGNDRVRGTAADHPTSAGQYKAQNNVYDVMGRLVEQTNPTEINVSWIPAGDDAEDGWVSTYQSYDWQGRLMLSTDQQGNTKEFLYGGCGCAGGQVVVTRDEMGRRQKMTYDVLGRLKTTQELFIQPKYEPLNGDGDVYSMTTNTYNVRDQITNISRRAGTTGPEQNTVMSYDGHGRQLTSKSPIESAPTSYAYNADDTLQVVTDAQGVVATYAYNNRHQVASIAYGSAPGVTHLDPVTFGYDAAGNRLWMDDGPGRVDYNFDILSRLQSETREISGVGSYTLTYEYNLAGQLKRVTDPAGSSFSYVFNKAGQLTGVDGSGPASAPQYATNIQYRAWGAIKHMDYYHGVSMNRTFTARMQAARYELDNVWDNLTFPVPPVGARKMGYNFDYHPDGNLRFAGDLLNNKFDRSYGFDHVGRLNTAFTGKEARGETVYQYERSGYPYSQTFNYDVFGNMTLRDGYFWQMPQTDSATYPNNDNRRQGWSYDNSGNVVDDVTTGTHTYDCANRQVKFVSKAKVGGFATGFPEQPVTEIETSYDGDGASVKRIETRREEVFGQPQPPPTDIQTVVTTTYYLRSSVLGMVTISEIGDDGLKKVGYVYDPAGERLAKQNVWSGGSSLAWHHFPGGTGSWIESDLATPPFWSLGSTRFGRRQEMDPLGADVGWMNPFPDPTPYKERERPLYIDGGDPFDYSGGCSLDGLPISCGRAMRMLGGFGGGGPGFGTPPTFGKPPSISWKSVGDLLYSKLQPPRIVNVDPITPPFGGGFGFLPTQQGGQQLSDCLRNALREFFPEQTVPEEKGGKKYSPVDDARFKSGIPRLVKWTADPDAITLGIKDIYYDPDRVALNDGDFRSLKTIVEELAHVEQFLEVWKKTPPDVKNLGRGEQMIEPNVRYSKARGAWVDNYTAAAMKGYYKNGESYKNDVEKWAKIKVFNILSPLRSKIWSEGKGDLCGFKLSGVLEMPDY